MVAMTNLAEIQAMIPNSSLVNISEDAARALMIARVGTDSREVKEGELFVALRGDRFDAHDFLSDIVKLGVSAAIISNKESCPENLPAIYVADTKESLGKLAAAWRSRFDIPLVLVTGSNGKTTVKEMSASIFRSVVGEAATLVTHGNLNNEIGLPMTLLQLNANHRLAVVELGMNHPGETAHLAKIAGPTIVLINNAQREHQEFMNSVAAVAEEHSAALMALPIDGVAVFPAESEFSVYWRKAAAERNVIDFILLSSAGQSNSNSGHSGHQAAVQGRLLSNGQIEIQAGEAAIAVQLTTLGNHNVRNALAASAVALAAGVDLEKIKQGLESFSPVKGRMQPKTLSARQTLIDDSYNANPDSVLAAIDALKQSGTLAWLVLGDMGEVGDQGPEFHREIGAYAAEQGIVRLFAIGEQCRFAVKGFNDTQKKLRLASRSDHFTDLATLNLELIHALRSDVVIKNRALNILVKGSRFMRMERVAQTLLEEVKACS